MAGTDHTKAAAPGGPAIILVEPQLGDNIGAAARAMFNFGLIDLRLVRPRDGWPNVRAVVSASGADTVVDGVRVFATVAAAVADLRFLLATTARPRHLAKPVVTPAEAARALREAAAGGRAAGILFGAERRGLVNEDLGLADAILTVPINPAFASLNIAQAVLLVAYEWYQAQATAPASATLPLDQTPASKADLEGLFQHLEQALEVAGFFRPPERRPSMVLNLRAMLLRAGLREQEVRTLRGVIAALAPGALHRRTPPGSV
ncbi:MAG: RNA methyltransferase [Alphaproteobacteria bacterium]|nr:RNA methyltransferase [Alphaproteobacteria bacterium]